MRVTLNSGNESRTLRVVRRRDRLCVVFEDGREVELRLLSSGDGGFELEKGRARIHGAGATINGARQVWVNGRTVTYTREQPLAAARESRGESALSSAIPAVVLDVMVEPGQQVSAGDKLVVLESMKMVLPLTSGADGTVRAVRCAAGDAVDAGQVLVELEPLALQV
ncbi:MAG: acetyl-CoA carboxylase biotin carboxyl carrier protein subunit [Anaerolineae bacterium]